MNPVDNEDLQTNRDLADDDHDAQSADESIGIAN